MSCINNRDTSYHSVKTYMIGFILSIVLTVVPFWMVMDGYIPKKIILSTILMTAVIQIIVHMVYFLHMNDKSDENYWSFVAFVFTMIIITILIIGSLWIMRNLNHNIATTQSLIELVSE